MPWRFQGLLNRKEALILATPGCPALKVSQQISDVAAPVQIDRIGTSPDKSDLKTSLHVWPIHAAISR